MPRVRVICLLCVLGFLLSACGGTSPTNTPVPPTIQAANTPASSTIPATKAAPSAPQGTAALPTSTEPVFVLAAADLQFALTDIAKLYEQATGRKITLSFGSTGTFASQIENGAPGDLFFAADQSYIDGLDKKGLLRPDTRQLYATGRIVLAPAKGAATPQTLEDLLKPEYKKIAIANPDHAPYGAAAKAALQKRGIWEQLQPKIVLGENIAQTFQFVQTGNADAGIVALSVALGAPGIPYTIIDTTLYPPLQQEAAILKVSKQPEVARDFLAFINGVQGRPIMKKYGFILPNEQ